MNAPGRNRTCKSGLSPRPGTHRLTRHAGTDEHFRSAGEVAEPETVSLLARKASIDCGEEGEAGGGGGWFRTNGPLRPQRPVSTFSDSTAMGGMTRRTREHTRDANERGQMTPRPSSFSPSVTGRHGNARLPESRSRCGVLTAEADFGADRSKKSGHKTHCRACERADDASRKDELQARRDAVREAARQARLKELEEAHREKVAAAHPEHAAGVARQKKLLRELGVPDWSPEEFGPSAISSPHKARMRRRRFGRMCRSASGSRRSRPDSSPRLVTSRA